jgi:predicted ATP-dependent endonuclease of OLD family
MKAAKAKLDKVLTQIAKRNQQDLSQVLERLKDKYKVGLSVIDSEMKDVPYTITLGNDDGEVELEKWGSGTQNRTRILMTLFKAKKVRTAETSAAKITPIIFIEEPESYLHPSAQAEFGATLRELANEFKVQVIVTTHSPYLMSLSEPSSNVLLERKSLGKKLRQTEVISTTGELWMEPFGLALGINRDELAPWKDALFSEKDCAILVEGDTDKLYLEALRAEAHGLNKLNFDGIIFAYNGKDALRQSQLVDFIRSRFRKCVITYDLDVESEIEPCLKRINLVKGTDYLAVGPSTGRKNIEGLLPTSIFQAVYGEHPELIQLIETGNPAEARSAKFKLKRLYLEKFTKTIEAGDDGWEGLYSLAKKLNRLLSRSN